MAHSEEHSPAEERPVDERWIAALGQVLELTVLLNADLTNSLAELGLTSSRTHLLWELLQRGPSVQRDLAAAMGISARTVTGLVDGLVATGFVTREPHPTDRRAALVTFTEKGAATMARMAVQQQEFASLLFAEMPAERFDHFVAGLGDILAQLHQHGVTYEIQEEGT